MSTWKAETRIGEILLSIPKNTSYHGNQHQEVTSNGVENTKNKSEVTEEMGYSKDRDKRFTEICRTKTDWYKEKAGLSEICKPCEHSERNLPKLLPFRMNKF